MLRFLNNLNLILWMKQTKQTNNKILWIMDVLFVLDHDDNLHALSFYPVGFSCSASGDLKWCVTPLLAVVNEVRYTCFYNCHFFGAAGEFTQTNNTVIFVKNSRIHATHIILFSSNHFKRKQNFNILLEFPINVKFFNFIKKIYDILSITI